MYYIGKIDKRIYSCVCEKIASDEVIITDERIKHIVDRHDESFETYCIHLKAVVEEPDYIIEANKPNTALILKSFYENEKQYKVVLRLVTAHDDPNFKNSIITFMRINEKEWKRLIKNKKILYKAE